MRLQVDLTPFLWASLLHLLGQFLWHMTHVWPLGGQIPLCTITYKIHTFFSSARCQVDFQNISFVFWRNADNMYSIFSYVFYSKLQFLSENMMKQVAYWNCASFSLFLQVNDGQWCRLLLNTLSQLEQMNVADIFIFFKSFVTNIALWMDLFLHEIWKGDQSVKSLFWVFFFHK